MEIGNIGPASIKSVQFRSEAGDNYKIALTNDSINYYKNDELISVREVGPNFNSLNLYETATRIALKYNVPKEKLILQ